MSPEELAFRLLKVNDLYGDGMLNALCALRQETRITHQMLYVLGFSIKQAERFFAFSPAEMEAANRWLAESDNHLLFADSPLYPEPLRAISDYRQYCAYAGIWHCCIPHSSPLWGAGSTLCTVSAGALFV